MRRAATLALLLFAGPASAQEPSPSPSPTPARKIETFLKGVERDINKQTEQLRQIDDKVRAAVDGISEEDERALGQATAVQVVEKTGGLLLDDAALVRYVNRVGNNVAQQGSRKGMQLDGKPHVRSRNFVFGVLDDDQTLNAFSTPGGYIFVTTGLLRDLGSESELAWVLGHEVAHVDLEHGLQALKLYVGQQAFADSLMGRDHNIRWSDPGFFGKMAATMANLSSTVHGKKEEREADLLGVEYAVAAGYDANGAGRVLEMLAERTSRNLSPLATHDLPYARRVALGDAINAAIAKPGYSGRVGASRYTKDCVDRLDGIRAASR